MWNCSHNVTCTLQYIFLFAAARGVQPAAPDAAEGAGDAQWHPQRRRDSKRSFLQQNLLTNAIFLKAAKSLVVSYICLWHKYLAAAAVHELRCNRSPVVAVSRQTKCHQQHSLHKVCPLVSDVDIFPVVKLKSRKVWWCWAHNWRLYGEHLFFLPR